MLCCKGSTCGGQTHYTYVIPNLIQNLLIQNNRDLSCSFAFSRSAFVVCNGNVILSTREEWLTLFHDILGLLNPVVAFLNTLRIFISNYVELLYHAYHLREFEMDKYYYSKANCEATQQMGIIGEKSANFLSDQKEKFDQWNNVYAKSHKVSIEEAIADSERDQVANRLGRERGRKYPYCDCSILMHDLLPDYKQ